MPLKQEGGSKRKKRGHKNKKEIKMTCKVVGTFACVVLKTCGQILEEGPAAWELSGGWTLVLGDYSQVNR